MTESTPVQWVPPSVAESLAAALQASLAPWAAAWGLPAPADVSCQALSHAQAKECLADQDDRMWLDASASAQLAGAKALKQALAQSFFATGHAKSPLADQVVAQSLQALSAALAGQLVRGAHPSPAPQLTAGAPGHWGLQGSAKLSECSVQVLLPMSSIHAVGWLPRVAPTALPRWRPEVVLAALPIHFVAHLGQANVDVGELASLDVGDVILVSQTSKDPMQLLAVDADLQLQAHLGAHGSHRAAQLMVNARGATR